MDRQELIKSYIEFFKKKDHNEIINTSLIPNENSQVLFVIAGMQPLIPYLNGKNHPSGKRLVNVQRCIRTIDIESIGDNYHHTFFEMLGNWSLGDYFKKESIEFSFEFLTKVLKIPKDRLAVSVFSGNKNLNKDVESLEKWETLGIDKKRIAVLGDNWWETSENGPCGPDTEIFYWKPNNLQTPDNFNPEDENWVEIWNNVLMECTKENSGKYVLAKQKNIDTGMGVERVVTVLNGLEDNYLAPMWKPIIEKIEKISKKEYSKNKKEMRIIADHLKAATFIISDGIVPGNSKQEYVLRRLIRRAIRNLKKLEVDLLEIDATIEISEEVFKIYTDYPELQVNKEKIQKELKKEEDKFQKTIDKGLKEFKKMSLDKLIDGKEAFLLYQSYGFPIEMIKELAKENNSKIDEEGFKIELKKHQELSRTSSAGIFKSGLEDNSEKTKKLHTVTHMLNKALKIVLNKQDLHQRGSNITSERLRFDFNFDRKLTTEEIEKVEELVNKKISENLSVKFEEMSLEDAKKLKAEGIFNNKYGEKVTVYSIGDFSLEICAGPHVKNTSELGLFKIKKESSSSSGVRRIKAVLE